MTIQGGNANIRLGSLNLDEHTFEVIFEYESITFGNTTKIASAMESKKFVVGQNTLSFDSSGYELGYDDDKDGMSNWDELTNVNGATDPQTYSDFAPKFVTATNISFPERTMGAEVQVVANDPNGGDVTYSLGVVGDVALFSIDAVSGMLKVKNSLERNFKFVVQVVATDAAQNSSARLFEVSVEGLLMQLAVGDGACLCFVWR